MSVELPGLLGQEVAAFVEVEAGWQVVAAGGPPAPALALATTVRPGVASVVIVAGSPTAQQVREALLQGAIDVLGWPEDRRRLLDAPADARARSRALQGPTVLGVAGLAGGVGTSTVALAVGGLLAWAGRRTLVVGGADLVGLCGIAEWSGPGVRELAALDPASAAAELASLARPVPGVQRLAVLGGDARDVDTAGWPVDVVVCDRRQLPTRREAGAADLLVARPDACVRLVAGVRPPVPVVVAGDGPLGSAGIRRMLGREPAGRLPHSARVARAGLAGRVPSSLPGSWLAVLRRVLAGVPA